MMKKCIITSKMRHSERGSVIICDCIVCNVAPSVDRLSYFETSAATGLNVSKAIDCLLDQVMLRMEKSIDKAHLLGMRNGTKVGDNDLQEVNEKAGCGC